MNFQLNLTTESVVQAHPEKAFCVDSALSVKEVLLKLREERTGAALVCENEKVVGIFTERDALKMLAAGDSLEIPITKVMNKPTLLAEGDSLAKAIELMSSRGFRRMAIVNEEKCPQGMLKVTGILHYLVELFPKTIYTLPPKPHHNSQDREGA